MRITTLSTALTVAVLLSPANLPAQQAGTNPVKIYLMMGVGRDNSNLLDVSGLTPPQFFRVED